MFKSLLTAAAVASALLLNGPANAGPINLVTNGGFETGDFSGWTQFGGPGYGIQGLQAVSTNAAQHNVVSHSGTYGGLFADGDGSGIFQTLKTVAGDNYDVSFWLRNNAGGSTTFTFNWDGGAPELELNDGPAQAYTRYSYSLVASTASTDLSFKFRDEPSFFAFDDVSVTAAIAAANPAPASAVPEPASLALACVGLFGAAGVTRRRRA